MTSTVYFSIMRPAMRLSDNRRDYVGGIAGRALYRSLQGGSPADWSATLSWRWIADRVDSIETLILDSQ